MVKPLGIALIVAYNDADVAAMMRSKLAILGIDILMLVLLAAAIGCTQQDEPAPTLPATGTSEAAPTASPTDRSAPPPTIQPTVTPTSASAIQPTHTPESVPTSEATNATDAKPTAPVVVTQTSDTSPECAGIDPTNTPDPNRPDGILGRDYQSWNVSTFEEAECIIDYSIAVPINLPEGFIRGENIIIHKRSTSHFEDRWVEHGWGIPGGPSYGFRVSQHSWKYSLGNGEPAVINGIPGQRRLRPAMPPDFPPLLTLLWEEDGYWYTVMGFLDGPITEEFLLDVAASLQPRDAIADTSPSAATPQECLALEPTSTPDTNPPEDGLGLFSESWELSSFDAAECITDYPVAVPTNLPALLWKGRPPSDSAWIRLFCTRYRLLFRSDWLLGPLPPGSAGRQPALGYLQVGQAQQHGQPFRVLSQTPIAHLGVVEASLHVQKGVFHLGPNGGLDPLRPSRQTPRFQLPPLPRPHCHLPVHC